MRVALRLTLGVLAYMGAASTTLALEAGDTVVVSRPTELTTLQGRVSTLAPGTSAVVRALENDRLIVSVGKVGRIDRASVIPLSEAIDFFSAAIAKDPADARALRARAQVWFLQADLDKATADLDASLRLDPDSSDAHTTLGWAWKRKGNKDRAMAEFDRAIALNPNNALAWRVRGATWAGKDEYAKAREHYTESIRIDPENPDSLHHRALLLAACTEAQYRDGKQSVADATRACELSEWKNPLYLIGLAAACAESGDFAAAVEWQTKARALASSSQQKTMSDRIDDYKNHRPFRMTWR